MGFLWQEYWSGLPFPPPVDHVLAELFTITCWVDLHSMAHCFLEFRKPLRQDKAAIQESEQTLGDGEGQASLACCGQHADATE